MSQKPHETVQIIERVLYGGASETPPARRLDHTAGVSNFGQWVFDGVGLVEHYPSPYHTQHTRSLWGDGGLLTLRRGGVTMAGGCRVTVVRSGDSTTTTDATIDVASSSFGQKHSIARHHHISTPELSGRDLSMPVLSVEHHHGETRFPLSTSFIPADLTLVLAPLLALAFVLRSVTYTVALTSVLVQLGRELFHPLHPVKVTSSIRSDGQWENREVLVLVGVVVWVVVGWQQ